VLRTSNLKVLVSIMIVGLILIIFKAGCAPNKKPFSISEKELQVIAFYEKGWNDLTYGYPSLEKHYKDIDILVPYWYTLHGDGSLGISEIGFEEKVVRFIEEHPEIKLIPLINNEVDVQTMITDEKVRTTAINNIVKKILDNNFAGVNIDFELLPPEVKDDFTAFIRDLSKQLKENDKIISVSVFPKLDGLEDLGAPYDYKALAKYADFITIMTYDKHYESSDAGSIAPYKWVEDNIQNALKSIPKNKLVVCIGAYGYDWPVPTSAGETEYIGLKQALQLAEQQGIDIQWDDDSQSPFFTYWSDGTKHEVWFENGSSINRKVALAKKHDIRGVAIWRIGFENDEYWDKLREALKK